MRGRDDERPGIGDTRAAGVGQESEIVPRTGRRQQLGTSLRRRRVADLDDRDGLQREGRVPAT